MLLQRPVARGRSPGYLQLPSDLATDQRFPRPPSSCLINLLEWLTELRETLIYIYQFVKEYDKGYRWTARWREEGKWEGWRVSMHSASISTCSPARKLSKACAFGIWGFLWRLHHMGMMDHKIHFQPLSPLWRMGEEGLKIPSISSWLGLSGEQPSSEPTQSHLFRTRHSYHPGNSKGFRNLVAGTKVKDQILEKKMLPMLLSLRKWQGF